MAPPGARIISADRRPVLIVQDDRFVATASVTVCRVTIVGMNFARLIAHLREIGVELDYGQRRALEVRTGYVFTPETERRLARDEVRRLEALYEAGDESAADR